MVLFLHRDLCYTHTCNFPIVLFPHCNPLSFRLITFTKINFRVFIAIRNLSGALTSSSRAVTDWSAGLTNVDRCAWLEQGAN